MTLKLQIETSEAKYIREFQSPVNQLSTVELQLGDEKHAFLLFSSLPDNWEMLIVTLSNSVLNGKFIMSLIKYVLFNKEAKRKDVGIDQSQALILENGGR